MVYVLVLLIAVAMIDGGTSYRESPHRMITLYGKLIQERKLFCQAQKLETVTSLERNDTVHRGEDYSHMKQQAAPLLNEELIKKTMDEWSKPLHPAMLRRPLIIVGPSGVGKNKLIRTVLKDYSKFFIKVVTYTTRNMRRNEVNGTSYHFVTKEEFQRLKESGDFFMETATVHNNSYGVPWAEFNNVIRQNKICILEIDIQGALSIRANEKKFKISPTYVFIKPDNISQLEDRLRKRNTETEAEIELRLSNAVHEIQRASTCKFFTKFIKNDNFDNAARSLYRVVKDR